MNPDYQHWFEIRETVDRRFRSADLSRRFIASAHESDTMVDLACGTGANYRYLSPFIKHEKAWVGIDNDTELLELASETLPVETIQLRKLDLANELASVPSGSNTAITASAFLDITSQDWLVEFATQCRNSPLLVAMTVAGGCVWDPVDAADESIRKCLDVHQRSDHGFGPAMGCNAAPYLANRLRNYGCEVSLVETNWQLGGKDSQMIELMLGGIARRVRSLSSDIDIERWEHRRRDQLSSGQVRLAVRHLDLLSIPRLSDMGIQA